jgi:hypothetical protein
VKENVDVVRWGDECGLGLDGFDDIIKEGGHRIVLFNTSEARRAVMQLTR